MASATSPPCVAMMQAVPVLADYVDTVAIEHARAVLTAARVELQRRAGRELNKLLLQEQEQVAKALGLVDADELMHEVATAGRTVAWEGDDAWRRRSAWSRAQDRGAARRRDRDDGRPAVEPAGRRTGHRHHRGRGASCSTTPTWPATPPSTLRLAAVAAERNLPISRDALNLLGRRAPDVVTPWPDALRDTLVRVLAAGPGRHPRPRGARPAAPARAVPARVGQRCATSPSATRTTASPSTGTSSRPRPTPPPWPTGSSRVDLLLLGTLLHDIGKGYPGDHTDVGMVVAADIATRMGLPPDDVATIVTMVRLHLLLPDTATRRDLDDPATAQRVADEVGDRPTLDLLAVMVEADSLATGPSAWGAWKAGLVADLVERARLLLAGEPVAPPAPLITEELAGGDGHRPHPRGPGPVASRRRWSPWWPPTAPACWPR